ncbi:YihY/virulence factor BrkB family protein [Kocuria sp. M1R5S2]|uniref:YihY/virulence factor BrkB family protein n=1 Tax=Kocuria rhizosphaerae TaxID=3376285 RepID=UPI0037B19D34
MATDPQPADADADDPDSAAKPASPTEITRPSWGYILRRTVHEFRTDECTDSAAVMTFFAVLSLFPGLLVVVSLLGVLGQGEATTRAILDLLHSVGAPAGAVEVLEDPVNDLTTSPSANLTLAAGLVGAVWTASGYVRAFARSMNRIYETLEGRPAWKLYPLMLGVTLVLIVLVMVMVLILILSGPVAEWIGGLIGLGGTALAVWNVLRWPVLLALLAGMIALLYYVTPNVRQPRFRWLSLGSALAIVVMALATAGFSYYVSNFGNYNATYGTIGGVIVLLLWLWIMNAVLLAGAEFNAETERGRQLQAGIVAEENLRLPSRDTRGSERTRARERRFVDDGRELRAKFVPIDHSRDRGRRAAER